LKNSIGGQAAVLIDMGRHSEAALEKAEESLKLAEEGGFGNLVDRVRSLRDNIRMSMMFRIH
jgi:hypothetical protein